MDCPDQIRLHEQERIVRGKRQTLYAHSGLPLGEWSVSMKVEARPQASSRIWFIAKDAVRDDIAGAVADVGDWQCGPEAWGLDKANVPDHRLWYVHRLFLRIPRVRGGTSALLRHMARTADDHGVWMTTEIMPQHRSDEALLIRLFKTYGGFDLCSEEWERNMMRPPQTLRRPNQVPSGL